MSKEEFTECEKFEGRLKLICRGEVLTKKRCNQYRILWGLPLLPDSDPNEHHFRESVDVRSSHNLAAYPCRHRGEVMRHDTNNLCGARGDDVQIYACPIHTECSLYTYCQHQSVKTCNKCEERE